MELHVSSGQATSVSSRASLQSELTPVPIVGGAPQMSLVVISCGFYSRRAS